MENQLIGENWRDWFNEWGDRFLLFARQQTKTLAEAEDIVQEAFVHIWSHREVFSRIEPGLVFTHIRRKAIDRARRNKRRRLREERYVAECEPDYFEESSNDEPEGIQEALEELPREQREVLVLKIWAEQTFESIGQTLDISPNTAASRYRYGLEHMRRLLKGGMK